MSRDGDGWALGRDRMLGEGCGDYRVGGSKIGSVRRMSEDEAQALG